MLKKEMVILLLFSVFIEAGCSKQNAGDIKAIRKTVQDYCEGFQTGDADRMAKSVHQNLAKRMVSSPEQDSVLNELNKDQMIEITKSIGKGAKIKYEMKILDIDGNIASVKTKGRFIDYLHLAKFNNEWVIINVLWENHTNKM